MSERRACRRLGAPRSWMRYRARDSNLGAGGQGPRTSRTHRGRQRATQEPGDAALGQDRDLELHFIEPGKPTQNAFIKSFGARLRHECLNEHVFSNVQEGQSTLEQWRRDYHQERPHRSLGGQTPNEFAEGLTRAVGELRGESGRPAGTSRSGLPRPRAPSACSARSRADIDRLAFARDEVVETQIAPFRGPRRSHLCGHGLARKRDVAPGVTHLTVAPLSSQTFPAHSPQVPWRSRLADLSGHPRFPYQIGYLVLSPQAGNKLYSFRR